MIDSQRAGMPHVRGERIAESRAVSILHDLELMPGADEVAGLETDLQYRMISEVAYHRT